MFAWQATVQDDAGNAIPLPLVSVYEADGVTLASIYSQSGAYLPNPMTGTLEGFAQFWADAGEYRVVADRAGEASERWVVNLSGIFNFPSRNYFVALASSGFRLLDGQTVTAGGLEYIRDSSYSGIPDLNGWRPVEQTPFHYSDDFTAGLNTAITAVNSISVGGDIYIRDGEFAITSPIAMKSNVRVVASSGAIIDCSFSVNAAVAFTGAAGAQTPITSALVQGGYTLNASSVFAVGDRIRIVGQRNSLSREDSGEWWCGGGTAGLQYAYFAEFNEIAEVVSAGVYRLSNPITFPGYLTNAAGETETQRTATTVQKIEFVENSHIEGGVWVRDGRASNEVIAGVYAKGCSFFGRLLQGRQQVFGVSWSSCWDCVAGGQSPNDPSLLWDYSAYHGRLNRYITRGSQDCGFIGLDGKYAAQCVDFSYNNAHQYVNIRPFCRDSTIRDCFEGITSHPGCYAEEWTGNSILNCYADGITIRGLAPIVTGNVISGNYWVHEALPDMSKVGVMLLYGATRDAVVRGNTVSGFHAIVSVTDSSTLNWQGRELRASIADNKAFNCWTGLYTTFQPWSGLRNIEFKNNTMSRHGRYIAHLGPYSAGVDICDNAILGDMAPNGYLALVNDFGNSPAIRVTGNKWMRNKGGNAGQSKYLMYRSGTFSAVTYPSSGFSGLSELSNNDVRFYSELTGVINMGAVPYEIFGVTVDNMVGNNSFTIAAGLVTCPRPRNGRAQLRILTEAGAAADDLDMINATANSPFYIGDQFAVRTSANSFTVTLRDASVSGVTGGFQLPSNAPITLSSSASIAVFEWNGANWSLVSYSGN